MFRKLVMISLLASLSGCGLFGLGASIEYIDGCKFAADGINVVEAEKLARQWEMSEGCSVRVITDKAD